jgi:hypothetical protein
MYLRRTQRKRTDGTPVGYLQLAHNRRVDGVTRAEVLVNLGREDELDLDGLRRLAPNSRTLTKERQRHVVAARRRRALTLAALKSWCSATSIPAVQTPD